MQIFSRENEDGKNFNPNLLKVTVAVFFALCLSLGMGLTYSSELNSVSSSGFIISIDPAYGGKVLAESANTQPNEEPPDFPDPPTAEVPTLSQWGFIALAVLFSALFIWELRRKLLGETNPS